MKKCFFCEIQKVDDEMFIAENNLFIARYDDIPVSSGYCEFFPKKNILILSSTSLSKSS